MSPDPSIGPRGQELLRPFLLRSEDACCFSPAESEKMRREKLTAHRKTPGSCGNTVGSNRKEMPVKKPGLRYDSTSYAKAVKSTITACNKPRRAEAKAAGVEPILVPKWTPYQLRHTAATKVRKEMGYECAGATLGHTNNRFSASRRGQKFFAASFKISRSIARLFGRIANAFKE